MYDSDNDRKKGSGLVIIYDGDCPFCNNYAHMINIRTTVGKLLLINARNGGHFVEEAITNGLDLEEGMAAYYRENWYHGSDCMHLLALLSVKDGFLNRIISWTFGSRKRAATLYPILRAGRNLTLRLLGRKSLNP